jgi:hypothetical protein
MKLLITRMQFSPPSYLFIPFRPKYSPHHPVLKHSLYFSLNVRDKVSHTYKTTGKIIFLYILIFTLLPRVYNTRIIFIEKASV